MKFMGPMLVVKDMERSKEFYTKVLGLHVISDLGANATFTGGLSIQSESSWLEFTDHQIDAIQYGGNSAESYFEVDDLEGFLLRTSSMKLDFLNPLSEMPWGQRVVRFYDPDRHVIEVGESFQTLVTRLSQRGMSVDEIVTKTMLKKGMVERILKKQN